jgi:hypothetical protein
MLYLALMAEARVAVDDPARLRPWERAAERAALLEPALTVHLGDLTRDGALAPGNLHLAADCLQEWPTPWRCLPGHADLAGDDGRTLPGALLRFRRQIGADCWSVALGRWYLLGINAALLGTDSEAEQEQWEWLETLARRDRRRNLLLCVSRPLPRTAIEGAADPAAHLHARSAERLLQGPVGERLAAVFAGGLPSRFTADGYRHDRLVAADGVALIDQLVIGEPSRGLGWVTLWDRGIEIGHMALDRLPDRDRVAQRIGERTLATC